MAADRGQRSLDPRSPANFGVAQSRQQGRWLVALSRRRLNAVGSRALGVRWLLLTPISTGSPLARRGREGAEGRPAGAWARAGSVRNPGDGADFALVTVTHIGEGEPGLKA